MRWWPWGKEAREAKEAKAKEARDRKMLSEAEARLGITATDAAKKVQEIAAAYTRDNQQNSADLQSQLTQMLRGVPKNPSPSKSKYPWIAWHQTAPTSQRGPDPVALIEQLREDFEYHRKCWDMNEQAYNNQIAKLDERLIDQENLIHELQNEIDALKHGVVLD